MTSGVIDEVTIEFLDAFADAWNRHDVDAGMSFMSTDCVFNASAGPEVGGRRYGGGSGGSQRIRGRVRHLSRRALGRSTAFCVWVPWGLHPEAARENRQGWALRRDGAQLQWTNTAYASFSMM